MSKNKIIHNHYQILQFRNKLQEKDGLEFQNFFNKLIIKLEPNFQAIQQEGGDGGNDGYVKEKGKYFACYAPKKSESISKAADKLKDDFNKLYNNWNEGCPIKEFIFVYNNNDNESNLKLELSIKEIESQYLNIKFDVWFPNHLENIFNKLSNEAKHDLGIDIGELDKEKFLKDILEEIRKDNIYLANNNFNYYLKYLSEEKEIKNTFLEEYIKIKLSIELGNEDFNTLKNKLIELNIVYPDQIILLKDLFELSLGNREEAIKYLEEIRKINQNAYQIYKLEINAFNENIDKTELRNVEKICDNLGKEDFDLKVHGYFYLSILYNVKNTKDYTKSDKLLDKAFSLDRENNFLLRIKAYLYLLRISTDFELENENEIRKYLKFNQEIQKIDIDKFSNPTQVYIYLFLYLSYHKLGKFSLSQEILPTFIEKIIKAPYNNLIDHLITIFLGYSNVISEKYFQKILYYINNQKKISNDLAEIIFPHFFCYQKFLDDANKLYKKNNNENLLVLIDFILNKEYDKVIEYKKENLGFLYRIAIHLNNQTFKNVLINFMEESTTKFNPEKEKIYYYYLFIFYLENENTDKAYHTLENLNKYNDVIKNLPIIYLRKAFEICYKKEKFIEAITYLDLFLDRIGEDELFIGWKVASLYYKFLCYFYLSNYEKCKQIGKELLQFLEQDFLTLEQKEAFIFHLCRIYNTPVSTEKFFDFFEKNKKYIINIDIIIEFFAPILLRNNKIELILELIEKSIIANQNDFEYIFNKIWFTYTQIDRKFFDQNLDTVQDNSFVKLKDIEKWYYIGDRVNLNAYKINKNHILYNRFVNKKVGDNLDINKFSIKEKEIVSIINFRKYIYIQTSILFPKAVESGSVEGVESLTLDIDEKGDLNIEKFLDHLKNINKNTLKLDDLLLRGRDYPLHFLIQKNLGAERAFSKNINEAIIEIYNSKLGNINSKLNLTDYTKNNDIETLLNIIQGKIPFVIESTSIILMSFHEELLNKFLEIFPDVIVPIQVVELIKDNIDNLSPNGWSQELVWDNEKKILELKNLESKSYIEKFEKIIKRLNKLKNLKSNFNSKSLKIKTNDFEYSIQNIYYAPIQYAIENNFPLLTDDPLLLEIVRMQQKIPHHINSFTLFRFLYKMEKITLFEYLTYYRLLTDLKYRCLNLKHEEIDAAIGLINNEKIINIDIENIKYFNFKYITSKRNGADQILVKNWLITYAIKLYNDSTVSAELFTDLLIKIIKEFSEEYNKTILYAEIIQILEQDKTYQYLFFREFKLISFREKVSLIFSKQNNYPSKIVV